MLSLLLELPNKSFWYDHKITDMPRLPDYLDVVFLSSMCEALTSGHCRKILLPTTSQNWWNVDQVAHKLHNVWSIMSKWEYFFCLMAHFANNSKGIQEIPLMMLWLVYNHRKHDCFGLWPASGPISQWLATWFNKNVKCHGAKLLYDCRSCCFLLSFDWNVWQIYLYNLKLRIYTSELSL